MNWDSLSRCDCLRLCSILTESRLDFRPEKTVKGSNSSHVPKQKSLATKWLGPKIQGFSLEPRIEVHAWVGRGLAKSVRLKGLCLSARTQEADPWARLSTLEGAHTCEKWLLCLYTSGAKSTPPCLALMVDAVTSICMGMTWLRIWWQWEKLGFVSVNL